jgi:hypothetical protein
MCFPPTPAMSMMLAAEGRAADAALELEVRTRAAAVEAKLIAWRRDIHLEGDGAVSRGERHRHARIRARRAYGDAHGDRGGFSRA